MTIGIWTHEVSYGSKAVAGLIGQPLYRVDSVILIVGGSATLVVVTIGLVGLLLPQKCLLGLVSDLKKLLIHFTSFFFFHLVTNCYQTTDFRLFQTESLQTTISNFDENSRKLSKRVENTVGKEEIASYGQCLLFPQCFEKACFPGVSKGVIVWE